MPNTVVKLTNAESTWLEAAREDRKLLMNMKAHLQRCAFCFAFGSGFRVQGSGFMVEVAASPPFLLGRCSKVVFKSRVTSHNNDTREGIVSHAWYEILRLSPHLFWLGVFTHGSFSSAQDDDTRGRKDSYLGDTLRVLELAVLYYDTSSPLEKGRAEGAGWIHAAV